MKYILFEILRELLGAYSDRQKSPIFRITEDRVAASIKSASSCCHPSRIRVTSHRAQLWSSLRICNPTCVE